MSSVCSSGCPSVSSDCRFSKEPWFQLTYSILSVVAFGAGFWSLVQDLVLLSRSPLSSLRFYVRILLAPVLILGLYLLWLRDWSDVFSARALVALAMSSLAVGVHARQLVNKPPAWLTAECALFLGVLPLSLLPEALQPTLRHGLLGVMAVTLLISMSRYLREMIAQYPEIGFPLLWLPSTHRVVHQPVSNKLAA